MPTKNKEKDRAGELLEGLLVVHQLVSARSSEEKALLCCVLKLRNNRREVRMPGTMEGTIEVCICVMC